MYISPALYESSGLSQGTDSSRKRHATGGCEVSRFVEPTSEFAAHRLYWNRVLFVLEVVAY